MLPTNSKVRIRKLKYDECKECPHCGDPQYNDGLKIGGHLQFCTNRYISGQPIFHVCYFDFSCLLFTNFMFVTSIFHVCYLLISCLL